MPAVDNKASRLRHARKFLARDEYVTTFLSTLSFADAEMAYRRTMDDLNAEIDEACEMEAITHQHRMVKSKKEALLQLRRQETKELDMVHRAVLKHILVDPDAGVPDEIKSEDVKELDGEELTTALNGIIKVQDQRRKLLSS